MMKQEFIMRHMMMARTRQKKRKIMVARTRPKRRKIMAHDMPYLPKDVVIEILKRLPVKSLIRLQCVSKHWKNLINSPAQYFITENLRHSTHQNPSLLFWTRNRVCLVDYEMHVREVQYPPLLRSLSKVWIVGSCNGLICVGINENNISSFVLWNPSIGEVRRIPITKSYKFDAWDCTGFGFDAIANDYKIVQAYDEGQIARINKIEVYSLRKQSWREIELGILEDVIPGGKSVTFNGCIFWYGMKHYDEEYNYSIVSFDIAMEVFSVIPGPPRLYDSSSGVALSAYEDKLALLSICKIGDYPNYLYSFIHVWALEEGVCSSTERWSWTKKYTGNLWPPTLDFPKTI